MTDIRILLLADSHLGFDLPTRPRVERRRRGHDFQANYETALAPALAGEVDVVVHGGDVFHRSRVAPSLAYQAFEPLARVANRGVPVLIVPGNHERSRLPHSRLAAHRHVHIFDRPRTFVIEVRGTRIAFAGFPSERRDVRARFPQLLEASAWRSEPAEYRVLCMHQCVEGATVGPGDFTFTSASDVIRARDLPSGCTAVLSGHIHRHQVLQRDLKNRPLATPVLYPGSLERTSFAELGEPKGFMLLRLCATEARAQWQFREIAARPMILKELEGSVLSAPALQSAICALVSAAPSNAVLKIRVNGSLSIAQLRAMSATRLRAFVPETMNVEVRAADGSDRMRGPRQRRQPQRSAPRNGNDANLQLEL